MIGRRIFCVSGLATLAACAVTVDEEYIRRPDCSDHGPFSLEYRGVGAIILRGKTTYDEHVGIVIPTVPIRRKSAIHVLELDAVTKFDAMILCPLHGHWDHTNHLDLFKALLKPGGRAILIADDSFSLRRRKAHAGVYTRVAPRREPITFELFGKRVALSLRFPLQGIRGDGHAAHLGPGTLCGPRYPHCGTYLLASPARTRCLLATISVENREFTMFANDAASAYVAQTVAKEHLGTVDLALVAAADAQLADGYPSELLDVLDAQAVRWVHWESFVGAPENARDRMDSGGAARTGGKIVLSAKTIKDLHGLCTDKEKGCFLPHRHHESFPGRWVCRSYRSL